MHAFNQIMASIVVALVAAVLLLTAASFVGVRAGGDVSLLAGDCGPDAPVADANYAGMRPGSC